MMRRLFKPLWVLLAVIFLIEAWLWDHLEPIVERVVARIPLRAFKHWLAEKIDTLSPAMTLIVFVVPAILLFPLKLVGLWLLAHEYWVSAITMMVFAKFLGLGVTAFIFDVTRPKLLEMQMVRKALRMGAGVAGQGRRAGQSDQAADQGNHARRWRWRWLAVADAAADPALSQERARSAVSSCWSLTVQLSKRRTRLGHLSRWERWQALGRGQATSDAPRAARTGRSP